jgi:hypothetical protein
MKILLLTLIPFISLCQENSNEFLEETLKSFSENKELRNLIGTNYENRNAMFFFYENHNYSKVSDNPENFSIYLRWKTFMFGEPISCYMHIESFEKKGSNLFVNFRIQGDGNNPCVSKSGFAKFKNLGEGKLELTKLKI